MALPREAAGIDSTSRRETAGDRIDRDTKTKKGPEVAFTTRSGPDVFRFQAIWF
jgi:hypothetical protein